MNEQKSKSSIKSTWSLVLSIVALLLCLLVFGLWIFEVIPHSVISSETFIGSCVTLMSIIVTIAVGWQIFNVIEMRQMMRQLEEKQKSIDEAQRKLDEEVRENYKHALHVQHMILAESREERHVYVEAIYYYLGALYNSLELQNQPSNNTRIFSKIQDCLAQLSEKTLIPEQMYSDIMNMDVSIRASKQFQWFSAQYEQLFKEFVGKISVK